MAVTESERSAVCRRHSSIPLDTVFATGLRDPAKDGRYFQNAQHRSFHPLQERLLRLVNVLRNRPQAGSYDQLYVCGALFALRELPEKAAQGTHL